MHSYKKVTKPNIHKLMKELRWSENLEAGLFRQSLVQLGEIEDRLWSNGRVQFLWLRQSSDPILGRGCFLAEAGAASLMCGECCRILLCVFDAWWSDLPNTQAINCEFQCVEGLIWRSVAVPNEYLCGVRGTRKN